MYNALVQHAQQGFPMELFFSPARAKKNTQKFVAENLICSVTINIRRIERHSRKEPISSAEVRREDVVKIEISPSQTI